MHSIALAETTCRVYHYYREDVILTPHNAFNTAEALEEKARQSAAQIEHFLKNETFIWPVPDSDSFVR